MGSSTIAVGTFRQTLLTCLGQTKVRTKANDQLKTNTNCGLTGKELNYLPTLQYYVILELYNKSTFLSIKHYLVVSIITFCLLINRTKQFKKCKELWSKRILIELFNLAKVCFNSVVFVIRVSTSLGTYKLTVR